MENIAAHSNILIEKNQKEVIELQKILKDKIEIIVDRGCNLNQLNEACESLEIEANQYNAKAVKLKRYFIFNNRKWLFIILLLAFIFISAILAIIIFIYI
jgi:uncharacterized tellurite resistance protein B-like protein